MKGWQWQSNPKDVSDAANSLEEANKKLEELKKQQALEAEKKNLQDQINALKELSDAWGENLDKSNDSIANHQTVLDFLKKFQGANLEERKALLAQFTIDYNNNIIKENASTQTQIDKLKQLKDQVAKSMDIQDDINKYAGATEWLKQFENASYEQRRAMLGNFTSSWQSYYSAQINSISGLEGKISELEGKMNGMKNSANAAIGAIDALNSRTIQRKITGSYTVTKGSSPREVHVITVYSDGSTTDRYVGDTYTDGGNGWNVTQVGSDGKVHTPKYHANGGVNDFDNRTGIVDWTGAWDKDKYVDGTKSKPEVILNSAQAVNVLYRLSQQPVPKVPTISNNVNKTSSKSTTVIQNLNITAKDNDQLGSLIRQAKQMAKVRIG